MIFSDDFASGGSGNNVEFVRGEITGDLTHRTTIDLLRSWNAQYEERDDPNNDDSMIISLKSGVEIGIGLLESDYSNNGIYGYWINNESLR